jgi:hypothetical protein
VKLATQKEKPKKNDKKEQKTSQGKPRRLTTGG